MVDPLTAGAYRRPTILRTPRERSRGDRYEVRMDGVAPDGTRIIVTIMNDQALMGRTNAMADADCQRRYREKLEKHSSLANG